MKGFKLESIADSGIKIQSQLPEKKGEVIEAVHTNYVYKFSNKGGIKPPGVVQLTDYYAELMKKAPGKKTLDHKGVQGKEFFAGGYVFNGREVWINVAKFIFSNRDSTVVGYTVRYMENPEAGYINAAAMDKVIKKEGKVVLDIHFESGKSAVMDESLSQVNELVTMLRNDQTLKVSIEGHTDKMGSAAQNKELSEERAEAVGNILKRKGIDPGRLSTIGWGWSKPVSDNKTEMGRAQNRRVEIVKK